MKIGTQLTKVWDATISVVGGNLIVLNTFIKKNKRKKKPPQKRRKEIIKITEKLNKIVM